MLIKEYSECIDFLVAHCCGSGGRILCKNEMWNVSNVQIAFISGCRVSKSTYWKFKSQLWNTGCHRPK